MQRYVFEEIFSIIHSEYIIFFYELAVAETAKLVFLQVMTLGVHEQVYNKTFSLLHKNSSIKKLHLYQMMHILSFSLLQILKLASKLR